MPFGPLKSIFQPKTKTTREPFNKNITQNTNVRNDQMFTSDATSTINNDQTGYSRGITGFADQGVIEPVVNAIDGYDIGGVSGIESGNVGRQDRLIEIYLSDANPAGYMAERNRLHNDFIDATRANQHRLGGIGRAQGDAIIKQYLDTGEDFRNGMFDAYDRNKLNSINTAADLINQQTGLARDNRQAVLGEAGIVSDILNSVHDKKDFTDTGDTGYSQQVDDVDNNTITKIVEDLKREEDGYNSVTSSSPSTFGQITGLVSAIGGLVPGGGGGGQPAAPTVSGSIGPKRYRNY